MILMGLNHSNIARVRIACDAIAKEMGDPAFRSRFPNIRLLRSAKEVEAVCEHLPSHLLPFMTERQPTSMDVYGFESGDEMSDKVVVWNSHAVVADWSSFEEFPEWLRGDSSAA